MFKQNHEVLIKMEANHGIMSLSAVGQLGVDRATKTIPALLAQNFSSDIAVSVLAEASACAQNIRQHVLLVR